MDIYRYSRMVWDWGIEVYKIVKIGEVWWATPNLHHPQPDSISSTCTTQSFGRQRSSPLA